MSEANHLIVIGTVDQINAVLQCINPGYPNQDLSSIETAHCFYVMNGVEVEVFLQG